MTGAPTHTGSRLPFRACVHTRLEVFLPVMVEAMTTSTAATPMISMVASLVPSWAGGPRSLRSYPH